MGVFAKKGFHNLSLHQIAEAVGVSHGLLRHHFGSKEALLAAVLTHRETSERAWREDLVTMHGLLGALPRIMEHNATVPGLTQLDAVMRAEAVNPESPRPRVLWVAQRFRAAVRADLERKFESGRLRADLDLDTASVELTATVEGVQSEWLLDRSVDMASVVRAFANRLRLS